MSQNYTVRMDYEQTVVPLGRALTALALALRLPASPPKASPLLSHQLTPVLTAAKRSIQIYCQSSRFFPLLRQIRALSYGSFIKPVSLPSAKPQSMSPNRSRVGRLDLSQVSSSLQDVGPQSERPQILNQSHWAKNWTERQTLAALSSRTEQVQRRRHKKQEADFLKQQKLQETERLVESRATRTAEWASLRAAKKELQREAAERLQDDLRRSSEQASLGAYTKAKAAEIRQRERQARAQDRREFVEALKAAKAAEGQGCRRVLEVALV